MKELYIVEEITNEIIENHYFESIDLAVEFLKLKSHKFHKINSSNKNYKNTIFNNCNFKSEVDSIVYILNLNTRCFIISSKEDFKQLGV